MRHFKDGKKEENYKKEKNYKPKQVKEKLTH